MCSCMLSAKRVSPFEVVIICVLFFVFILTSIGNSLFNKFAIFTKIFQ